MVDGALQLAELAVDLHEHLIQMPAPLRIAAHVRDASLTNLGGEHRAKPVPPEPDRLVAEGVSALLIRFPARAVGASGPECVASGLHGPMSIPRSANRSSTLRSDSGPPRPRRRRAADGEIVKRLGHAGGFVVLPKRWIVERTLAWLGRCRRLPRIGNASTARRSPSCASPPSVSCYEDYAIPHDVLGQTLRVFWPLRRSRR